jgi:DNA-binding YbaB/EbfC family protein
MGKGMKAGKRPKAPGATSGGGGKDMQKQMQQVQAMQKKMDELQGEIEKMEATATSGGGAVSVIANGKKEITSIKIKPEVVDPDDIEMLEDLILTAANEAIRQMEEISQNEMAKLSSSLGLPPGMM